MIFLAAEVPTPEAALADPSTLLTGGVFGVLAFVILYLLNNNRKDRQDYRVAMQAKDSELEDARDREAEAQEQVDHERRERRRIENEMNEKINQLQIQVGKLQRTVESLGGKV